MVSSTWPPFSIVMTGPAEAASLVGSMPGGAAAVLGVVLSGISVGEEGVVPGFCGGWLPGAVAGASGPGAAFFNSYLLSGRVPLANGMRSPQFSLG